MHGSGFLYGEKNCKSSKYAYYALTDRETAFILPLLMRMKFASMQPGKGRSLHTTTLLLASLISVLLVAGSITASLYIGNLNSKNAASLLQQNIVTDSIEKLGHHIWRVESRLNTIFTPYAGDDHTAMLQDMDLAIQELHELDTLETTGSASLKTTIAELNGNLSALKNKILELIDLSTDPNWVFPILPYISGTLLKSNQEFSTAVTTALNEIANEESSPQIIEMYRRVTELRDLWRRQILDFRAIIIRIVALNQTEDLTQKNNLQLRHEVIMEQIDVIENLYRQDPFGFDTEEAIETMRYRASKWMADYNGFGKLTDAKALRADVNYIKTEIQPVQKQVAGNIKELEHIVKRWSTENIGKIESAARTITIEIWLLSFVSLLFVGLTYNIISKTLLRPIAQLSDDLQQDSHATNTQPLATRAKGSAINSKEVYSLIDSYNTMKKVIHARDRELLEINKELENQVKARTAELEYRNNELNAYNYSVSHDLRSPLRSIDGFSLALLEDCGDQLDESGKDYLHRIRKSAQRMGELIDDMLELSAITRAEIRCELVNLSELANTVFNNLKEQQPERQVEIVVQDNITAEGDRKLLKIVLENLLGNAWKYSNKRQEAVIEFGEIAENSKPVFYIKDNGAGFNMQYANKLFGVFQRLHGSDYEGTGIGLATVKRVIERHGGKVWADAKEGSGATFYFTLA